MSKQANYPIMDNNEGEGEKNNKKFVAITNLQININWVTRTNTKSMVSLPTYEKEKAPLKRSSFKWLNSIVLLTGSILILYHLHITSYNDDDYNYKGNKLETLSKQYLKVLQNSNLAGNWSEKYTSTIHLAGQGYELVEFTSDKFKEYGFDSKIESYNVYLNRPTGSNLELFVDGKSTYKPTLVEDKLPEDPTTIGDDLVPAFHGYSANGNVTEEYVFANYGTREDFQNLTDSGVSVKGKIVIVRYGAIFRGLKVKFAQDLGAIGVLIYSDPADDHDDLDEEDTPYPKGPGRNPSSIQRGSVQFLSSLPGDPTRFTDKSPEALANLTTIPQIPSLPISYKEVIPILSKLNGHGKQLGFKGGISKFDYSTGPAPGVQLNIFNNNTYSFEDIYNVYGLIEGEEKDKVIIIGNHRDAWIKGGAGDPNSGSATLLEIARALNELFKVGYKPRYSILLASWDGEEYGLLGSTGFAEKYANFLQKSVISYINLDAAVTGTHLHLASSPILNEFLLNVADEVNYPGSNKTLKEQFVSESKISILGSGSDYTSFFEHLGISSFDVGFTAGKGDSVYHYHSNYDSFHWISKFADPGFVFHNTLAQYVGLIVLKLSEAKILTSFNSTTYAIELKHYFDSLKENFPKEWYDNGNDVDDYEYENFLDSSTRCSYFEHREFSKFSSLVNSTSSELDQLTDNAAVLDAKLVSLQTEWDENVSKSHNPIKRFIFNKKAKKYNSLLQNFEKRAFLLHHGGLNGREWFKHIVFASGRYTGYAGQSLPGITEAVEDLDFKNAAKWTNILRVATKKANIIAKL